MRALAEADLRPRPSLRLDTSWIARIAAWAALVVFNASRTRWTRVDVVLLVVMAALCARLVLSRMGTLPLRHFEASPWVTIPLYYVATASVLAVRPSALDPPPLPTFSVENGRPRVELAAAKDELRG